MQRLYKAKTDDYLYTQSPFSVSAPQNPYVSHIFDVKGKKQSLDKLLQSNDGSTRWDPAFSNE